MFYHDHELDLIELSHELNQHELYFDNLQKALYCLRVSPLQRPEISKMLIHDNNCKSMIVDNKTLQPKKIIVNVILHCTLTFSVSADGALAVLIISLLDVGSNDDGTVTVMI